jgi:RNA polymerase sigma factor (sigma-70 family)
VILAAMPSEPATDLRSSDPATRRASLQAIYLEHREEVFGFLVTLLRDRHQAEDVLQESFVRVYANAARFDPTRPIRPWLFEIVRNAGLDTLRKMRKSSERGAPEKAVGDGLLGELSEKEQIEHARAALDSLPDETRALLLQRHELGMKLAELAESFGVTERTIRNRLNAAADEFAHALVARDHEAPSDGEGGRS